MNRIFLASVFLPLTILIACQDTPPETTPELPDLSILDVNTEELDENHTIEVELTLSEASEQVITVSFATADGSAVAGADYVSKSGNVIFQPGSTSELITIEIIGDTEAEELETFTIGLHNASDNVVLYKNTATISITDPDEAPSGEVVIPTEGYTTPESYEGMTLVWRDEFNGESLNLDDWRHEIGTGSNGWGNNELQYYTDENTSIVEGNLVIEARKENFGGRAYTSSRIITLGRQDFQYGRVDIRAVLPRGGQGIWPALWMLGSNFGSVGWPRCGEIDIMEMVGGQGREKTVHGTLHWWHDPGSTHVCTCDQGAYSLSSGTFNDKYHVFSIIWTERSIRWLVDDVQFLTIDTSPTTMDEFRNPFFFIFNVAVGGNWPGNPTSSTFFPQHMVVDYVRVFQETE